MNALEQRFEARVRSAILECHGLGYHPADFEGMLRNDTATRVAQRLVQSGELQSGLRRLAQMGRLDLAIESIMLDPEFESLFAERLREAARWRLEQVR